MKTKNRTKFFTALATLMMLMGLILTINPVYAAEKITIDNVIYTESVSGDFYTVTGFETGITEASIPDFINGKAVD